MKILIINWQDIKNPFGGGAEVHLHEIFKRIVALGHEVTLLCCEVDNLPKNEVIDGIKVIRHGNRNTFNFGVKKYYLDNFANSDFDIIIDDVNKIPFYTPKYVSKPLMGISHHFFGTSIFKEANPIVALYVYISEYLMKFLYNKTPFAVVSESTLDEFKRKGFDTSKYRIIYNAIDTNQFTFELTPKEDILTITYFGRLKKYKSIQHLLLAYSKIKSKIPESQLYIIGRGDYESELKKLAKELNIEDNIKFWGFVDEVTKLKLLAKSHIVVNTSIKEGWGITNIETNACGTPVISANSPGLRDSVKVGQSGYLYEYGNIQDLSEKLLKLINDGKLLNQLSLGAIQWAKNFSWDKSAEAMIEYMKFVIAEHNKIKK